jgi:hypothetical protein
VELEEMAERVKPELEQVLEDIENLQVQQQVLIQSHL